MTQPQTAHRPANRPPSTGLSLPHMTEQYERDRLGFLLEMRRQHGPVVEMSPGTFLVADPAAAHDILRRTNNAFLLSHNTMKEEVPSRAGDPALDAWMVSRRAVQSAIAPRLLVAHGDWVAGQFDALADRWLRAGTVSDPLAAFEDLLARAFVRFCFGTREAADLSDRIQRFLATLLPIISSPLQIPPVIRRVMPRFRRAERARQKLRQQMVRTLAEPGTGGMADALVAAGMPAEQVAGTLVPVSVAACGVPAAALAWAIVELTRQPRHAADTAAAVASHRGEGHPPIIRWTIDETLRMWPPTWLIYRATDQDQTAAGWVFPAQSAVMISPYVIHRTADCYDHPDEFRPQRWQHLKPPHGAYLPFGSGPRWCLGSRLARTELETALATLTTRLHLTVPHPPHPDARRTLLPANLTLHATAR